MPITDTSALLRGNPPQKRTSVRFCLVRHFRHFPWHSDSCFPRSTNEPVSLSCHLYAACRNAIDWLLHCLSPELSNTDFWLPTAAACRGFDASACTPTPRDLLSSHRQLRLHLIWKVANPLYIDMRLVAHGQRQLLKHVVVQILLISQTWRMNGKFMFLKNWG